MFFRFLFVVAALVAAGVLFFFVWGISDGTVSSFNFGMWLGLLAVTGGVIGGGWILKSNGNIAAANAVLLVLAIPGILMLFFVLALIVFQPNWR